jgi:tripartite-type tricarboxylate transporter receptor subunit TctC
MRLIRAIFCVSTLACWATAQAGAVGDYPNRPLHLIVGYPPGGSTDVAARLLAEGLGKKLGQAVIVENRPGGGGNIAAAYAAKQPADGYTLYQVTVATAISASLYDNLQYDLARDFVGVSQASSMTSFLVVHPSLPVNSVKELIAMAKAHPGQLNFASSGIGNSPHLAGEMFNLMAGVDITHVPYKGTTPMLTDLLSGVVKVAFPTMPGVVEYVRAGKLRALAINSNSRSPLFPDVPTMAEAGLPGYVDDAWNGVAVPAGTPPAIVEYLSKSIAEVLASPDLQQKFTMTGATAVSMPPAQFNAYIKSEIAKWHDVIRRAHITLG